MELLNSSIENSGTHLNSRRFDVIFKLVYAHYYIVHNFVPDVVTSAYTEHIKVFNNFKENYRTRHPQTFSANVPCKNKTSEQDFVSSYRDNIDSIRNYGFKLNTSFSSCRYFQTTATRTIVLEKSSQRNVPWIKGFYMKRI